MAVREELLVTTHSGRSATTSERSPQNTRLSPVTKDDAFMSSHSQLRKILAYFKNFGCESKARFRSFGVGHRCSVLGTRVRYVIMYVVMYVCMYIHIVRSEGQRYLT
jgi:hypothetical protein